MWACQSLAPLILLCFICVPVTQCRQAAKWAHDLCPEVAAGLRAYEIHNNILKLLFLDNVKIVAPAGKSNMLVAGAMDVQDKLTHLEEELDHMLGENNHD
jgi:hypothetical protein